jgi:hypothetical protein
MDFMFWKDAASIDVAYGRSFGGGGWISHFGKILPALMKGV